MKSNQADLRKRLAAKTRKIVVQQKLLTLAQFLAQGQERSRQQRKPDKEALVEVKKTRWSIWQRLAISS